MGWFMALHMMLVRMIPEAPTREPAMIRPLLLRTKPVAAAARPAHRDHEEDAQDRRRDHQGPVVGDRRRVPDQGHGQGQAGHEEDRVDRLLEGETHVLRPLELLELQVGHEAAPEGDRPDEAAGRGGDRHLQRRGLAHRVRLDEGPARHQHRGATSEAVEQRHHLRHRRHLHPSGEGRSEGGADHDPGQDRPEAQDVLVEERHHDREQHPDGADEVAPHRGARVGEALESEDEEDGRDQVDEALESGEHGVSPCS
jgi:hypothetical protein